MSTDDKKFITLVIALFAAVAIPLLGLLYWIITTIVPVENRSLALGVTFFVAAFGFAIVSLNMHIRNVRDIKARNELIRIHNQAVALNRED